MKPAHLVKLEQWQTKAAQAAFSIAHGCPIQAFFWLEWESAKPFGMKTLRFKSFVCKILAQIKASKPKKARNLARMGRGGGIPPEVKTGAARGYRA